ncbi:hypothetical protein KR059_000782 [Drosophila kikkawai]|nr:hypothetical protein KR059_000782 [Drosophila kikkawai]
MHRTGKHSENSQLSTDLLQMSRKKCNNNQQRRGRRRWDPISLLTVLVLTICMAHTSLATVAGNSSSASSTVVTVAVTPSIADRSSSSSGTGSSTTESLAEQQQPQGQCLQDGVWVAETAVRCKKQASCRAIQRTGHCCPDYKCDCEKDGKTYANGYKLVDPDTPCTVCYCKGGDIVCSSVTCFRRDDCMPKYVPGRCCPEYDNCPILDNNPLVGEAMSSSTSTTQKPAPQVQPAGFNWNITIKEITKPTEIRITDDNKVKPSMIPTRKVANSNLLPTTEGPAPPTSTTAGGSLDSTTAAPTTPAASMSSPPALSSTPAVAMSPVLPAAATAATPTVIGATPTQPSQDSNPKVGGSGSNESLKLIASVGYIERPLASSSSNVVEQQVKPLVTYNSDGLQPLAESDPSKVNIKREYTTEGVGSSTRNYEEAAPLNAGLFIQNGFRDSLVESDGDLEPDTAGSDNIYHIISTTEGPGTASNKITTDAPPRASQEASPSGNITKSETEISTEGPAAVSSEMPPLRSTHHMEVEDDVPQVESNPAYPSLPGDDFSLRDVNFPLVELEDIGEPENDEPRSITSPFDMDTRHVKLTPDMTLDGSGSGGGSGGGDIDLYQEKSPTTDRMMVAASSVREKSVLVPLLMYSGEDISGETRIQNGSDLQQLEKIARNETGEEVELGSGEIRDREQVTPKTMPVSALDIDELGSGAGQVGGVDPKADAESLKLDESQESGPGTSSVDKSSARAEKSFVERALPLGRLYLQRIY